EPAVTDQVGARVADVAEDDAPVADQRDGHRRPHPRGGCVLARTLVHPAVRLLDDLRDAALAAALCAFVLADRAGGEARRKLARLGAAHAVGDREERGLDDVVVLVPAPLLAGVGPVAELRDRHVSYLSSVSPRGVACDADLEAVAALPLRPSK